ncbi:MAG: hypothetical protein ABEJ78_08385 [Haloferacaceae archaeon]
MTVETHVRRARSQVRAERDAVDAKLRAFETFLDRVADVPAEPTTSPSRMTATSGPLSRGEPSTDDRCRVVRRAFAETIRPHSVADVGDDESLLATVRHEFSDSVAVALAPTTETPFSPDLKRAVLSRAKARRTETEVLGRALDREEAVLDDAGAAVDEITAWVADADETPLTDLGFAALRRRHETLAGHRDRCSELARTRQGFLRDTTNRGVDVGVRHRSLVSYLYGGFPVDYPLLSTVVRLDDVCATCQRAVRSHLVRRA